MSDSEAWYVVKQDNGQCAILAESEIQALTDAVPPTPGQQRERWGPFASQSEAIARRVGLIRAGKCQPM